MGFELWIWLFGVAAWTASAAYPWQLPCQSGFVQHTDRFWIHDSDSDEWKSLELPFQLLSCQNGNCQSVALIQNLKSTLMQVTNALGEDQNENEIGNDPNVLQIRRRTSLRVVSERSVWMTGESGSVFERFWNGIHWVIAPHDLPASAGYASSSFFINNTFLALCEAGLLYQLTVNVNAQPSWIEIGPSHTNTDDSTDSSMHLRFGVSTADGKSLYFVSNEEMLIELSSLQPVRWISHGRPRGGDVAAIVDAKNLRPEIIFTVSAKGELYEFDASSKPSWRKHIWNKSQNQNTTLAPIRGCTLHGLIGTNSASLFILSKNGQLIERQFFQRKWKWIVHPVPGNVAFSALGPVIINEASPTKFSIFLSTTTGSAYEYRLLKLSGATKAEENLGEWIDHKEPHGTKIARSVPGALLHNGRILFALDDGRIGELHLAGIGGEDIGPCSQGVLRRKPLTIYEWSIIDAPETEGWNTGYCTESPGPFNCLKGVRDELRQEEKMGSAKFSSTLRRKGTLRMVEATIHKEKHLEVNDHLDRERKLKGIFSLRVMESDVSFLLVTESGEMFEHLRNENSWIWVKHDHKIPINGLLGFYNGSVFAVDNDHNLFIREWTAKGLMWLNCSAMDGGTQVTVGSPFDSDHSLQRLPTIEDSLYFVDKYGNLIRFTVALRKFLWKNCGGPKNARVAYILDQELLRYNVVFVVGNDGHLYQYNRLYNVWHEYDQSPYLILSQMPGVAIRESFSSKSGSLFMRSDEGGLVEFHWNTANGWNWIIHGVPNNGEPLLTAPGPGFDGNQLFVVSADGRVYSRYKDGETWRWKDFGLPPQEVPDMLPGSNTGNQHMYHVDINCEEKVSAVRPMQFSKNSVVFMLRDRRLAELQRTEKHDWKWVRIINTPESHCHYGYLTFSKEGGMT